MFLSFLHTFEGGFSESQSPQNAEPLHNGYPDIKQNPKTGQLGWRWPCAMTAILCFHTAAYVRTHKHTLAIPIIASVTGKNGIEVVIATRSSETLHTKPGLRSSVCPYASQ